MSHFRTLIRVSILSVFILALAACGAPKPTIMLASPPHGSQFREGEDVAFQSTAMDSTGITRVELVVDGAVVRMDSPPGGQGQQTFTLVQTWKATQGTHAISVRAYNAASISSDPAAISISVSAAAPTPGVPPTTPISAPPTSVPTTVPVVAPTTAPTDAGCANNSAFVTDVTVPDGTVFAPGQTVSKTWRIRNNGTCTWEAGYQLVFVGGEAMGPTSAVAVPYTAPGATADLTVAMTAPNSTGVHVGQWKVKGSNGVLFGTAVTVNINVVDPSQPPANPPPGNQPTGCSGSPFIESFTADDYTIYKGTKATLSWGAVANADSVEIDQGIGGVAAPGSATVSPAATTTYTMTAHCGANTAQKQVKITVSTLLIPKLPLNPALFFKVESVTISSTTSGLMCPNSYAFTGTIKANASGDVQYTWERSNGTTKPGSLHFDAAGTKTTVPYVFSVSSGGSGNIKLHVTSPTNITSSSANYSCLAIVPKFP